MFQRLLVGAVFLVGVVLAVGCSPAQAPCDATNCPGCCSSAGLCEGGSDVSACGLGGGSCATCIAGQACTAGQCVAAQTGCGPGNCASGCCQGGVCKAGTENSACGTAGATCGTCGAGQACNAAKACEAVSTGCAMSCSGCCVGNVCNPGTATTACGVSGGACATCQTGQTCGGGACQNACPPASVCGSACCSSSQTCIGDGTGAVACHATCSITSQCSAGSACSLLVNSGTTLSYGACLPIALAGAARCATAADCANITGKPACAPFGADGMGVTAAVKVCVPNDGAPYHGCNGSVTCSGSYDCWIDSSGNSFCSTSGCASNAVCGAGGCCSMMTCANAISACGPTARASVGPGCNSCP